MLHQRHHARAVGGVRVDLLELVARALEIFARRMMLDQHHGDVVAFLRVGHVEDAPAARLQPHRLVVEHPVAHVVVAFLDQEVRRLPGLGQAGAEPAARRLAGRERDHLARAADVGALVLHLLHVALGEAVADELPVARIRGLDDLRIGGDRRAVDRERRRHLELVEHLEHAPEADAVAVFVPGPVRDVGRGRAAGRRGQHRARHRRVDVPFLDVDDAPHHHARAAGQGRHRASGDRRIGDALGREQADGRAFGGVVHSARPRSVLSPSPACGRGSPAKRGG